MPPEETIETKGSIVPVMSDGYLWRDQTGAGKYRYMDDAGAVQPALLSKAIQGLLADFTIEDHIRSALVRRARRIATRASMGGKSLGTLEYKGLSVQPADINTDSKQGIVTAYAAAFGNTDDGDDILYKRAFKDTIDERFTRAPVPQIKVLFNHKADQMVGSPLALVEDDHGLETKSRYNLNTFWGNEAFALVAAGDVTNYSFGYLPREQGPGGQGKGYAYDDLGRRHLYSVNLFEYGPLAIPMNSQAFVVGVKSGLAHGGPFAGLAEQAGNAILDLMLEAEALATRRMQKEFGPKWLNEDHEKAIAGFLQIAEESIRELKGVLAQKPGAGDSGGDEALQRQARSARAHLDLARARLAHLGIKEP